MSGRPTPETDKAFKYWPSENAELVDANFARKLERERDEAREKYFAMRDLHTNATELAEKYQRERDELKCKIKELDQALKASAELLCFFFQQSGITKEDLKERLEAAK